MNINPKNIKCSKSIPLCELTSSKVKEVLAKSINCSKSIKPLANAITVRLYLSALNLKKFRMQLAQPAAAIRWFIQAKNNDNSLVYT